MLQAAATPLRERANQLKAELDAVNQVESVLQTLRDTFARFPELRSAFSQELGLIAQGGPNAQADDTKPQPQFTTGTSRERIEAFLKSRANEAATVEEISTATGMPQSSVRHLFSTRFPERFQKLEVEGERLSRWKIREVPGTEGGNSQHELRKAAIFYRDKLVNALN